MSREVQRQLVATASQRYGGQWYRSGEPLPDDIPESERADLIAMGFAAYVTKPFIVTKDNRRSPDALNREEGDCRIQSSTSDASAPSTSDADALDREAGGGSRGASGSSAPTPRSRRSRLTPSTDE